MTLKTRWPRPWSIEGARYVHVMVPCPAGLGIGLRGHDPSRPHGGRKRAVSFVRSRTWRGHPVRKIRRRVPVEDYLGRSAGSPISSRKAGRTPRPSPPAAHGGRQHRALQPDGRKGDAVHEQQAALRDHPRSGHLASPIRPVPGAPCGRNMSTGCRPATMPARPARTSRSGCSMPRREITKTAWQVLMEDNPMPGVMGRVCYHPCEDGVQPRAAWTRPSAFTRSNASSAAPPGRTSGRRASMPSRRENASW